MSRCPACQGGFEATFCPRDGTRLISDDGLVIGDRYRLLRKVGEGAMGEVYEAEHLHLQRRVAVKLLQRKIASEPEVMARFQREARSTTGLGHPNIVDTIDFGFAADGQPYLVMEWLDGENLDDRLSRGLVDVPRALAIAAQACAGLAVAHDRGVIHRDLKPANLFLTRDHRGALLVKVLDFGIAKLRLHETRLTATGVLIGTPNYMAPEQAQGTAVDVRTDVYALGVILYEMLAGEVPFQGDTALAVLHQTASKLPTRPSLVAPDRGITPELDAIVMRCLAKRPDERFATMHELGEALAAVRAAQPRPASRAETSGMAKPRAAPPPTVAQRDDESDFALPARRRWVAPLILGGLALVAVPVVLAVARTGASAHRDAGTPVAVADAGSAALVADGAAVQPLDAAAPGATFAIRGRAFGGSVTARPAVPAPGAPLELAFELATLEPALREAARAGKLLATVELRYYKDHSLVQQSSSTVDEAGRFTLTTTLLRAAKHHAHVDLVVDGKEVDHAKLDLFPDLR